ILTEHPERPRALVVESSNPVHSLPGAGSLREAIRSLEFSLCVDVAMTETARECDYVLPASTTYEKWEATFFPRNFPANIFHLRKPLLSQAPGTLTEQEIHARIIDAMGIFEEGELDELHAAAQRGMAAYRDAFFAAMGSNPKVGPLIITCSIAHWVPRWERARKPRRWSGACATSTLCAMRRRRRAPAGRAPMPV
ncbi:MAG: molybdopterin-dependent oxidoreductase, partial [Halioglobus sp.]